MGISTALKAASFAASATAVTVAAMAQSPSATPQPAAPPGFAGKTTPESTAVRAPVRREVQPSSARSRQAPTAGNQTDVAGAAAPAAAASATAGTHAGAAPAAPGTTGPAATAAESWSAEEIKQAKAQCDVLLRGVSATYAIDDPIKHGVCGAPVVYRVSAVGKGPEVQLNPPAAMTCEMIVSLDKWVRQDVQAQARALLGGSVVRIETMSSYSCRNAYGRAKTRLSEHGRANALDISGFTTAKDTVTVLASWGPTVREMKVLAAAKEAERLAKTRDPAPPPTGRNGVQMPPAVPGVIVAPLPGMAPPPSLPSSMGLAPTRLGGPKSQNGVAALPPPAEAPAKPDPRQTFLREIHARACKHFGTVLGPEANNAHKNHFHVDMAPRRTSNFCE